MKLSFMGLFIFASAILFSVSYCPRRRMVLNSLNMGEYPSKAVSMTDLAGLGGGVGLGLVSGCGLILASK
jgi:hypothetical protein